MERLKEGLVSRGNRAAVAAWPRAAGRVCRGARWARARLGTVRRTLWRVLWAARPPVALALAGQTAAVRAGLPELVEPEGVEEGDFIGLLQAYALDTVVLAGLGISAVAFLIVAKNVLGKYSDVASGKATWGEVGAQAAVGVVLLVLVVYLLTEASGVLEDS